MFVNKSYDRMTDWTEISLSDHRCCPCRIHYEGLVEATEATPLIRSNSSIRVAIFINNFDRIWLACLAFIMITGTTIGVYLLCMERPTIIPDELDIVSRTIWGAQSPKTNLTDLSLPVQRVLIYQTNTSECRNYNECAYQIKNIQKVHMDVLNEPDIVYNFVIAGDGRIYEGRGWKESFVQNDGDAVAIAFVGNFTSGPPTESNTKALLTFLDFAVIQKKIVPCYQVSMFHLSRRYFIDLDSVIKAHKREQNQCDNRRWTEQNQRDNRI